MYIYHIHKHNTLTTMSDFKIDNLLKAINNTNNEKFVEKSYSSIMKQKNDILQQMHFTKTELKQLHTKLKDYKYIDDISDVNYGSYIRWIPLKDPDNLYLTNGGIVTDIKITQNGVSIQTRNSVNRFTLISLDKCIVFQKFTNQEKIILEAMKFLEN